MPTYTSISYHDVGAESKLQEFQAAQTWENDCKRMGYTLVGELKFESSECKLPTGTYVVRILTTGEYERE